MLKKVILYGVLIAATACAPAEVYRDPKMDFGSIYTLAVMPFTNLSKDPLAADRVRDVFMNMLLASGEIYVLPPGEVAKGIGTVGVANPASPSSEEAMKLGKQVKADAVITGVVREYGEVRSGSAVANVLSMSLQMIEAQTGRVVWSVSTTKGGIGVFDRLFGGGGEPLNIVTEKALKDVINKLYK
jgi:TolB-like protein